MKRPTNEVPAELINISQIVVDEPTHKHPKKEVEALAQDIKANGMYYPIVVAAQKTDDGGKGKEVYRLKAGKARLEAAKIISWKEIKAVVIPYFEDDDVTNRFVKLIESCQRRALSDYDIARAACEMDDKFEVVGSDFAHVMGLSAGYTYNLKRWYRNVPAEIREAWKDNHPLLNQSELERYSHLGPQQAIEAWKKRLQMKTAPEPFRPDKKASKGQQERKSRRASESQILKLQQAIDESALAAEVKSLCASILKFVLGVSKDVPGITDYRKLPPTIINKKAQREANAA